MIKRLKFKFILINMLLVTVVLVSAFVSMYISTANNLKNESISLMREISQNNIQLVYAGKVKELYNLDSTFVMEFNRFNNNITPYGYEYNDISDWSEAKKIETYQYLKDLYDYIKDDGASEGYIAEENFRYVIISGLRSDYVVFLDKSIEDNSLKGLIVTFIFVGAGCLAAFLFVSVIITGIAVEPVEKSIKQQQQLVSDVSHELKTPITVISANADIVLENPDSTVEEQSKWLHYIKTETSRMTELINNMLYLAKSDEKKIPDTDKTINLSDLLNSCMLPLESICYEKEKTLDITIQPNVYVKGNEMALKQLFIILADNAIKYSDSNGTIQISLRTDHERVYVSFHNTGPAIPSKMLPHIFERFYRVDKSRSREEGGYGLGLSIARTITEAHGAKINVTSTAESGTTFNCIFKQYKI